MPVKLAQFHTVAGRGTERADADDSGSKMKKRKAGKLPARNWSPTARPSKRKRAREPTRLFRQRTHIPFISPFPQVAKQCAIVSSPHSHEGVAESVRAERAEGDDVDIFSSHNVRHPVTIDASEGVAPNDDHISQLRAKHRITVKGDSVPAPIASFDELQHRYQVPHSDTCCRLLLARRRRSMCFELQQCFQVKQFVVRNVDAIAKYSSPTPIQMQAIPALLSGRELLAYAPTGTSRLLGLCIPLA